MVTLCEMSLLLMLLHGTSGQAVISQGIKLFLKPEQVYFFSDIGIHGTDSLHCPQPKELNQKCVCNKKDSIGKMLFLQLVCCPCHVVY